MHRIPKCYRVPLLWIRRFYKDFTFYGHSGNLGHTTKTICIIFCCSIRRLHMKLVFNWPMVSMKSTLQYIDENPICATLLESQMVRLALRGVFIVTMSSSEVQQFRKSTFQNFPLKCIRIWKQIWYWRKVKGNLGSTKSQGNRPSGSGEDDFKGLFTIYGRGGHPDHVTSTNWTNFRSPILSSLHMKSEFNWAGGIREDVWKYWRTTEQLTISSP